MSRTLRRLVGISAAAALVALPSLPSQALTVTAAASDVSLTREMKVLESGGTAIRAACGRITRHMTWGQFMPME